MRSDTDSVFTTKGTKDTKGQRALAKAQRTQTQCRNYEMRETREKGGIHEPFVLDLPGLPLSRL